MLRIRQAPNTVVGVGIGVGAVRVGECRFGNVPVPARGSAGFLGGGVAQGFTEQVVPIVGRTDSSRPAVDVVIERLGAIAGIHCVAEGLSGQASEDIVTAVYIRQFHSVNLAADGEQASAVVIGILRQQAVPGLVTGGAVRFHLCNDTAGEVVLRAVAGGPAGVVAFRSLYHAAQLVVVIVPRDPGAALFRQSAVGGGHLAEGLALEKAFDIHRLKTVRGIYKLSRATCPGD